MIKIFKNRSIYFWGFIGIVALRLLLNAIMPLMDTTEARYAEVSRLMLDTGNWITPQIDYGVSFWAKPVLSVWLSTVSMFVFGVNEFAVRFPALILSLIMAYWVMKFTAPSKEGFFLAGLILITLPEFLLHMGVVSTDTTLVFCIVLTMLSFWKSMTESGSRIWNYLFFVGLGLGLLAKGPIVLILCIPPLVVWTFVYKRVKKAFKVFPWIWGTLLMLVISLPWYYIAEKRSPGFIDYFIVGEHFKRFFDSGWTGDKYGFPKTQPIGIVWLFLLGGAFPWIILAMQKLLKYARIVLLEPWLGFLLMWLVWTPLFFTVSSSLIHTYVLPVMVPVALLTLWFWEKVKRKWLWLSLSMIIPVAALILLLAGLYGENLERYSRSDKYLIENHSEFEKYPLYYFNQKSYSSQFYSSGRVKSISAEQLASYLQSKQSFDIIIKNKQIQKLEEKYIAKMTILGSNNHNTYFRFGLK